MHACAWCMHTLYMYICHFESKIIACVSTHNIYYVEYGTHMYTYIHTYIHTYIMCTRKGVILIPCTMYFRTCMYTYLHTYIHMHAYMIHVRGSPCTSKISHLLLYLSLWLLVPGPSGQCLHSYIQPALISAVFGNMQVYLRTLDRHMCICTL